MKSNMIKRTLCTILASIMATVCIPMGAVGAETDDAKVAQTEISPLAKFFDKSQINQDYIEWIKNGSKGTAPSTMDMSYLGKSYEKLLSKRRTAPMPSKYDLRDYGLIEPVSNQGPLGICWAIAANSCASSHLMNQFPQLSLSPIHTSWFSYT